MNAADVAAGVRDGKLKAAGVIGSALARIRREDPPLNCFTSLFETKALEAAEAVDAAVAAGRDPGALAGVPFAVKNLFDVEGAVTLAGSIIEAEKPPAIEDAPLVARLKAAGAILVGATNMDEYAYGFTTQNSHYGATRNPHDPTRVAGGSSGGSAAAVAAGFVPIALGSDTNGSIRVPASFCGVFGLKPTLGRLSRRGVTPFVHSLDHVGPFARSARDLALAYDACQGPDPHDPDCAQKPVEEVAGALRRDLSGLRVGALGGWFQENATNEVMAAFDLAADALGAERDVRLKGAKAARAAAFGITGFEGGSLHLGNLRARPEDFDPATRDRLIAGVLQSPKMIDNAHQFRRAFLAQALELLRRYDVLVAPATPFCATPLNEPMIRLGETEVLVRAYAGLYTQPISFIGLPVIAAPISFGGPMPTAVQLIAAPWREDLLFRAAAHLERESVACAPVARLPEVSL